MTAGALRGGVLAATVVGLAVAAWVVGSVGVAPVFATAAALGVSGFALFCLWLLPVLLVLGAAWFAVAPGSGAPVAAFVWARAVREAATDVLPFSQLGGLVVGARVLAARGVPVAQVHGSMIADLTTEMASQLVFTLAGVAVLAATLAGGADTGDTLSLALAGTAATIAVLAGFIFGQRPLIRLTGRWGTRLLPGLAKSMDAVEAALAVSYRRRRRVVASFVLNLAAWLLSGVGAWGALRVMGAPLGLAPVLAIESLIFAVRSVAFIIPGAVGVQEAAYALLGPVFGLPPESAVALSIAKRARDLAVGVPIMLAWQLGEGRRLLR